MNRQCGFADPRYRVVPDVRLTLLVAPFHTPPSDGLEVSESSFEMRKWSTLNTASLRVVSSIREEKRKGRSSVRTGYDRPNIFPWTR